MMKKHWMNKIEVRNILIEHSMMEKLFWVYNFRTED